MHRQSAEFFIEWNKHCDHGLVVWAGGTESEFPLTLSLDELEKYPLVFDYFSAQALACYPMRKREDIRSIRIAYKIRQPKPWNPEETDDLMNSLHRWYEKEVKQPDQIVKEPFEVEADVSEIFNKPTILTPVSQFSFPLQDQELEYPQSMAQ